MEDLHHTALIEERKQNLDDAAYEKNINQNVKIPSIFFKYRNDKTYYWPTSIKYSLNWLPFSDIMEFTADRVNNDINFYRH